MPNVHPTDTSCRITFNPIVCNSVNTISTGITNKATTKICSVEQSRNTSINFGRPKDVGVYIIIYTTDVIIKIIYP